MLGEQEAPESNAAAVDEAQVSVTPLSDSNGLPPLYSPAPHERHFSHVIASPSPSHSRTPSLPVSRKQSFTEEPQIPQCLLSPAFTPPTSAPSTPSLLGVSTLDQIHTNPNLMKELPEVCHIF